MKNILALIPARGGSVRVKNKNIRELGGKPLIAYTIEAALRSNFCNKVLVSTDCEEIAKVARDFGAEVPFLRPAELSSADSTEFQFHKHTVDFLIENGYDPDLVVNLYPTSPFRKTETIDLAIKTFLDYPDSDSLRSTTKCHEHPYKMWVRKDQFLNPFVEKDDSGSHTLSYHLLPEVHIQNASIYITKPSTLNDYQNTVGKTVLGLEMTEFESVDINTPLDFKMAEFLIEERKNDVTVDLPAPNIPTLNN